MPQGTSAPDAETGDPGLQTGSTAAFLQQALEAYRSQDHRRAESILGQVVAQRPQTGAAWHLRGLNAAAAGNLALASQSLIKAVNCDTENAQYCASLAGHLVHVELDHAAVDSWQRAVDLTPDNGTYQAELARCLSRLGRHRDALPHFAAATRLCPDDANLRAGYGSALLDAGDRAAAVAQLRDAFQTFPRAPAIAARLGYALQQDGQEAEAARIYWETLALDPDMHEARLNLSVCLRSLGDSDGAISQCRKVLESRPDSVSAMNNLGSALCDTGRHDEAIAVFENLLQRDPENVTALHNLGVALDARNAPAEAEACFRKCLDLRPGWSAAQRSLANLLRGRGRLREAAALYRAVIDTRPLDFASYGNLGLALLNLNKPEDAVSVYEKAAALGPDRPELRLGLGIAQLTTGDLANGWDNYDARLQMKQTPVWRSGHGIPTWQGEPPPDGGTQPTVLVHAEQGFGDTIHFCRFIPLVAARGAKVVFECQPSLAALMSTLADWFPLPPFSIIAPADPTPQAEFHIPLLSLPRIFTPNLEGIPATVPYLSAPPDKRSKWAEHRFGENLSVGVVWAGNPNRQDDRLRSCPLETLAPIIATPGVDFYSLQKGAPRQAAPGLTELGPLLDDFGDTAAVIERLDLIISVDTAVAHLAGALGKPVWVMLGQAADWRYLLHREDSPWYPTMHLFRQQESGDWRLVAERIAQELRMLLRSGG